MKYSSDTNGNWTWHSGL